MNKSPARIRKGRVPKPRKARREITVFRCQRVRCGVMTTLETTDTGACLECPRCGGPVKPVFRGLDGEDSENEL